MCGCRADHTHCSAADTLEGLPSSSVDFELIRVRVITRVSKASVIHCRTDLMQSRALWSFLPNRVNPFKSDLLRSNSCQ